MQIPERLCRAEHSFPFGPVQCQVQLAVFNDDTGLGRQTERLFCPCKESLTLPLFRRLTVDMADYMAMVEHNKSVINARGAETKVNIRILTQRKIKGGFREPLRRNLFFGKNRSVIRAQCKHHRARITA